jgi:hypothetical protein
VVILVQLV